MILDALTLSLRSFWRHTLVAAVAALALPAGLAGESESEDLSSPRIHASSDEGVDPGPRPVLTPELGAGNADADGPPTRHVVVWATSATRPLASVDDAPVGVASGSVTLQLHLQKCGHLSRWLDLPPPLLG